MAASSSVSTLQDCLTRVGGLTGLDQAPTLLGIVNDALAVPPPPGKPDEIHTLAQVLRNIAGDWGTAIGDLNNVSNNQLDPSWQGATSQLAKARFTELTQTMGDLPQAFQQAATFLDDWAGTLAAAQGQDDAARGPLHDAASKLNAMGAGGGNWGWDETWMTETEYNNYQSDVHDMLYRSDSSVPNSIQAMIAAASTINDTAQALTQNLLNLTNPGAGSYPFSADNALTALKVPIQPASGTPETAARQAEQDILQLEAGGTRTNSAQTQAAAADLKNELAQYDTNPAFASALMNELGPSGLMTFLGSFQATSWASPADLTAMKNEFGTALATASNGSGQDTLSADWTNHLAQAGGQEYGGSSPYNYQAYGYQILGSLLNTPGAHFSTNFLLTAGNDLLSFENSHGGSAVWNGQDTYLGPSDGSQPGAFDPAGADPIIGLMNAFSANPSAAETFLDPAGNGNLQYLLTQRQWFTDANGTDGHTSLGNALVAATGSDPAAGNVHDPANQRIMQSVMSYMGTTPHGNIPLGMGTQTAQMVQSYTLSGDINSAFTTTNQTPPLFTAPQVINVMGNLAADPKTQQQLVAAELGYTKGYLTTLPDESQLKDMATGSTTVLGMLSTAQEVAANQRASTGSGTMASFSQIATTMLNLPVPGLPGEAGPPKEVLTQVINMYMQEFSSSNVQSSQQQAAALAAQNDYSSMHDFMTQDLTQAHNPVLNTPQASEDMSSAISTGFASGGSLLKQLWNVS